MGGISGYEEGDNIDKVEPRLRLRLKERHIIVL